MLEGVASQIPSADRPVLLQGWGRLAPTAAILRRPTRAAEATELLAESPPRGTVARGLARSYGDQAQNGGGQVLEMTSLRAIRAFDAGTGLVTVEAGLDLGTLLRRVVPYGWFLSVSPGTRFVTVGGAVANDVHGKNHHRDGGFASHVRRIRLLTPAHGTVVVGPDRQPDTFWATVGGLGLTGIILEVTLQLVRVRTALMKVVTRRVADLDSLLDRMARDGPGSRYSIAWIDCLAQGRHLGRALLTDGDHAEPDELPARIPSDRLAFEPRTRVALPRVPTPRLLGLRAALAFNAMAWHGGARVAHGPRLTSLESFFYPLDAVDGWNRLYGPNGFIQYQFAVPNGSEHVLQLVIERLALGRYPTFLVTLKRLGPGGRMLSFPIAGWTLSVDLPAAHPGLAGMLDRFDAEVAAAGGRVYLAKDARLRRETFEATYPQLDRWREVRSQLDPEHILKSDLGRRLGLVQ